MAKIIKRYSFKVFALVLAISMFGFYFSFVDRSQAAQVSSRSDTLNNSGASFSFVQPTAVTSNHTFVFTIENSLDTVGWNGADSKSASDTIVITIDPDASGFDLTGIDCGDVDLAFGAIPGTSTSISDNANGGSRTTRTSCPGSATTWGLFIDSSADTLTFYTPTAVQTHVVTSTIVNVRVGLNATFQDTGNEVITNPTAVGTKKMRVGGTFGGTGDMLVAILSGVEVSATVAETLTFNIFGLPGQGPAGNINNMASCNSIPGTTDDDDSETITLVTTTATSVPFGAITSGNVYQGCQRLAVSTNAAGGYTVSQRSNNSLKTTGDAIIPDTVCDGTPNCTPYIEDTWTSNAPGLGVSCKSSTNTSSSCSASSPNYANGANFTPFANESAGFVSSTRFSTTSVAPWGEIQIKAKYRLIIPGTQAAGTYTNIVNYIATPIF